MHGQKARWMDDSMARLTSQTPIKMTVLITKQMMNQNNNNNKND